MADEFVEVVNTTLTSTQLPDNSTKYTLKTAGAAESFAIKDIAIENSSGINGFQFYLNDFSALTFSSGESGAASGLDLLPQSGTLKIRGTKGPIDASTLMISKSDGSAPKKIVTNNLITEFSRSDSTSFSLDKNKYSKTDEFSYTGGTNWNNRNFALFTWRNGTKWRQIKKVNSDFDAFYYADTEGTSVQQITNTYKSIDYDADNEYIYALNSSGALLRASATANISFSTVCNAPTSGTWSNSPRIFYLKGLVWAIENNSADPEVYVYDPSNGYVHSFTGSKSTPGSTDANQHGFCFGYDPSTDVVYLFNSTYNTANPHYIGRFACPKTLTEINAFTSSTAVSDAWSGSSNQFTRTSTTSGPFAYNYAHFMRGFSTNADVFVITDASTVFDNENATLYSYDWNKNALTSLISVNDLTINTDRVSFLPVERTINTADETFLGGAGPDSVKVRVTAIKTT
jgi:hypothetical protein